MVSVGFIGAGQMGYPMVQRLHAAGVDVRVFARRAEVAGRLVSEGIPTCASAVEAAAEADVTVICVFDDRQVRDVAFPDGGGAGALGAMRRGSVLVNHTTGSPLLAVELLARAPRGVGVVDAAVSGSPEQIRTGTLTVLLGGDDRSVEVARAVVDAYAAPILHVGALGDAQRVKLVNNLVFAAHVRVASLAADLGAQLGIDHAALAGALGQCSGASFAVSMLGRSSASAMREGVRPYLAKDVEVIRAVADGAGIDLGPLGDLARWVGAAGGAARPPAP